MNRLFLLCAIGWLTFIFPLAGVAQSYERLWKNVEESRKKDLPQTLIAQVNQIYEKARKEKNTPQMAGQFAEGTSVYGRLGHEGERPFAESRTDVPYGIL